jgi:heptosyltransferase-2
MFSLIEVVELLKKAKILISNDSAPTHLGMCADIPVLTIYCSTLPEFGFYPYNKKSQYLSYNNLACKPCGIHGYDECPLKNFACGNNLKSSFVISKIEEMVND